jgi:transposase
MDVCVGVDVSKAHLDWTLGSDGESHRVLNSARGVGQLIGALRKLSFTQVIVESTGGYERRLLQALDRAGVPVALINPWRARRFGEGLGVLAKTDPFDARILAIFGERAQPPTRRPLSRRQRLLADLNGRRRQIISIIAAEKSRLETASGPVRKDFQSLVGILERRIEKLDRRIDETIAEDPVQAEKRTLLESAPCVEPGIAGTLVVGLPELGTL